MVREVLAYLDESVQGRLLSDYVQMLKNDGVLVLGDHELAFGVTVVQRENRGQRYFTNTVAGRKED